MHESFRNRLEVCRHQICSGASGREARSLALRFLNRISFRREVTTQQIPVTAEDIIKTEINSSCEIEDFVETHLCKLCVILRSRALRVVCPH